MPTELEELVEFLHHGNTQIRQIASENLVSYSLSKPDIFNLKDLKLLVRDYDPIAKNALTILINLSSDRKIVESLVQDDMFLETLTSKIAGPNANEICMLLANLAKSDSMMDIAINQLMDCFVRGTADYDYLAYFFANVCKHREGRKYFLTAQSYDSVIPVTKLTVFTEYGNQIRRRGVAFTIKNLAFDVESHAVLFDHLPYILLPLAGPEEFTEEETSMMLPDLQLLPPDKKRDKDPDILITHLETLLLLTTNRDGRRQLRSSGVYPIVRECHLHVDHDGVREACDRLVQVIMRDEAVDQDAQEDAQEVDDDDQIVEIF